MLWLYHMLFVHSSFHGYFSCFHFMSISSWLMMFCIFSPACCPFLYPPWRNIHSDPLPIFWLFSVQFSHSVMSNSLTPHGLQHARLPCPSPTPGTCSDSCPLSRWCHPTISSSVVPSSSCLQPFPASGSFPVSQFFAPGSQIIGALASASVLPMNIQDWFL